MPIIFIALSHILRTILFMTGPQVYQLKKKQGVQDAFDGPRISLSSMRNESESNLLIDIYI